MDYPQPLNQFCNYLSHLNRSPLTIQQYRADLSMFLQYMRASEKHRTPSEEQLFSEAIDDVSVSDIEKELNIETVILEEPCDIVDFFESLV